MPDQSRKKQDSKDLNLEDITAGLVEILEAISSLRAEIATLAASVAVNASPWIRGDSEAAEYAGFKSRAAFRRWAKDAGIRPDIRGGLNFWDRAKLLKGGK